MWNLNLDRLIGKKVTRVFMNEEYVQFITDPDEGAITFTVEGDCCSSSIFYDFIGVKKLLNGGKVTDFKEISLDPTDIVKGEWGEKDKKQKDSSISVYGFAITVEDSVFGELTAVLSFRNYSNGYYGGWMQDSGNVKVSPEIFDDVIETSPAPNEDTIS